MNGRDPAAADVQRVEVDVLHDVHDVEIGALAGEELVLALSMS